MLNSFILVPGVKQFTNVRASKLNGVNKTSAEKKKKKKICPPEVLCGGKTSNCRRTLAAGPRVGECNTLSSNHRSVT